jgi:predicted transcriptional regulator
MMMMTVGRAMTAAKHVLRKGDPLSKAKELMQMNAVRHLPVLEGDRVIGIITMSDLYVMEAVVAADPDKTLVDEAMSKELYIVKPEEPLANVALEMAKRQVGSALIVENGKLTGIFTTTDACRVLGETLSGR